MNKEELLGWFIKEFPSFKDRWESEDNLFIDDNGFSLHGVCAEFSHYFIEDVNIEDKDKMKALFTFIESCLENNGNDLSNGIATCFIENIAQTKAGEKARPFFGELTEEYFNKWN